MLLNDTSTDRMQLTQQQREELTAHVKKWANIDGDYEATMLGGIWHYRCDSGIFEDALSVADREWITANTEADGVMLKKYNDEDGYTEDYYELITGADLQCNTAMAEQMQFAKKYDLCEEDVARECKFIEENDI
tara:strand:+ start:75 stop:476 length:402 start_codon:yes stop_codon:yes gene_type:complete